MTTRGMKEEQAFEVAGLIAKVLNNILSPKAVKEVRQKVKVLCNKFPVEI
jgi:glycine/serine hydroxymethyltransferase